MTTETPVRAPELNYTRLFDELSREVKDAGLMEPRPRIYLAWMVGNGLMLAAGWAAVALLGNTWWQLLVAVYLAFWTAQTGLSGHDTGHRQVFRSRAGTDLAGYLQGNVLTGVSYGWWVNHHNRHHSNPNHLDKDPDILRRQVIFATSQLPTRKGAVNRFIIRHQSWMFFCLILLEGWRLHIAGYVAAVKGGIKRRIGLDAGLLTVHLVAYFTAVFVLLPPGKAIAFVLIHQALFGFYMGMLFAPNHKGMPVREGEKEELDWLRRQVLTSRNLKSNRALSYLYGGLNYQVEHHLFPAMPSINLRRAQPIVVAFCGRYGLPYIEVSAVESYRIVSNYLGDISDQVDELEEP